MNKSIIDDSLLKQINVHDALLHFQFKILEKEIKDNYIYTRKVNIPMFQITQNIYEIQSALNNSFAYRGGFTNYDQSIR